MDCRKWMRVFPFLMLISFLGTAVSGSGQPCLDYEEYTHNTYAFKNIPYWVNDHPGKVLIDGDWVFVSIGITTPSFGRFGRFTAIDISDPLSPVAYQPSGGEGDWARDFAINDGLLVVTHYNSGGDYISPMYLSIYDVSDPTAWAHLDTYTFAEGVSVSQINLVQNLVFLKGESNQIRIFSISDPTDLTLINTLTLGHSIEKIIPAANGNHLFILGDGDLQVYSLADPANPLWVADYSISGSGQDMALDNHLIFIAGGTTGVQVVDVFDPASPVWIASIPSQFNEVTKLSVDLDNPETGDLLYLGGNNWDSIEVQDVTDLQNPVPVQVLGTGLPYYFSLFDAKGKTVYLTSESRIHGFHLGNFSDSEIVGDFLIPDPTTRLVPFNGSLFLVSGNQNLHVVDAANPLGPSVVGTVALPFGAGDLVCEGNRAFILGSGGVAIVDLSEPTHPQIIGTYVCSGSGLDVSGELLGVARGEAGLELVDVSDPATPYSVGFFVDSYFDIEDVQFQGGLAYLVMKHVWDFADISYQFGVVDISDPANPSSVFQSSDLIPISKVQVQDDWAFLHGKGYLIFYDLSDPMFPQEESRIDVPEVGHDLAVHGDRVYLADGNMGIQIVQYGNSTAPRLCGSLPIQGTATGVLYLQDYVYVADGTDRVEIALPYCGTVLPGSVFTDATGLYPGLEDWASGSSTTWVDFDIDGDLDLSVGAGGQTSHRFFINQLTETGSVSFLASDDPELSFSFPTRGNAWGILSGDDEYPDLYVGAHSLSNLLLNNTGNAMVDVTNMVTAGTGFGTNGIRFVDFDNDGLLDIHELIDGSPDRLLKNLAAWEFENVAASPIDVINESVDSAWCDIDDDGDQDVYITRGGLANILLRNDGEGVFVDVTPALLADDGIAQGATWGDFDSDGKLDLFLANWGTSDRLFHNNGNFEFTEITPPFSASAYHGQSPLWGDFDNDSDLDLYVTNYGEANQLYVNVGGGIFIESAEGDLASTGSDVGSACGDFDNDGDLDIFLGTHMGSNTLLRNDQDFGNNWIAVKLVGVLSNSSAVGARITLHSGGKTQTREVGANSGFWSQNPHEQHFGLGSATVVDRITIVWPFKLSTGEYHFSELEDIDCNQILEIVEPEIDVSGVVGAALPPTVFLGSAFPNPFNPMTTIRYELPKAARVNLRIYDIAGRLIKTLVNGDVVEAGRREFVWRGRDDSGRQVASGTYFYRLEAGSYSETKRMVLIK